MTPALRALRDACIGPTMVEYGEWPPEHLRELMDDMRRLAPLSGEPPAAMALRLAGLADADGEHGAALALRCAAVEMVEPAVLA